MKKLLVKLFKQIEVRRSNDLKQYDTVEGRKILGGKGANFDRIEQQKGICNLSSLHSEALQQITYKKCSCKMMRSRSGHLHIIDTNGFMCKRRKSAFSMYLSARPFFANVCVCVCVCVCLYNILCEQYCLKASHR